MLTFPFLTIFLIFIVWLAIKIKQSKAKHTRDMDDFWMAEMQANATPAKDIKDLSYITIPIEKFPLDFSTDEETMEIESRLKELSTHPLLNLTGKTNTEIKAAYGVPNFETMCQIGEDYNEASLLLDKYAAKLEEAGRINDAMAVLEFAVGTKTDIKTSYTRLGKYYKSLGKEEKLAYLIKQVEESNLLLKSAIIKELSE